MVYACDLSTQGAETGDSEVQSQPGVFEVHLRYKQNKTKQNVVIAETSRYACLQKLPGMLVEIDHVSVCPLLSGCL